jgi:hypothetical protein
MSVIMNNPPRDPDTQGPESLGKQRGPGQAATASALNVAAMACASSVPLMSKWRAK